MGESWDKGGFEGNSNPQDGLMIVYVFYGYTVSNNIVSKVNEHSTHFNLCYPTP